MSKHELRIISLIYLLIPNLIFALSWFRPVVSMAILTCWIFAIWWQFKHEKEIDSRSVSTRQMIIFLLLGIFMTAISGVDGYFYQNLDYWGHNSKYYTLFNHSWPVIFSENQQYACHYFGFFLVPALFSKLQGEISGTALLVWSSIGYWIALMWLWIISSKNVLSVLLFFILGSAGHFIKVIFYQLAGLGAINLPFVTEIWPVIYQSILAINQAVPAMIVASVLYMDFRVDSKPERSFLFITLNFIFGIFPTITFGMVFLVILIYTYRKNFLLLFDKEKLLHLFIPGLAILPVFFYFLSGGGTIISGFIWEFERSNELPLHYFFGIFIEIAILIILMWILQMHQEKDKHLILTIIVLLILVSTYRMGKWNDWFMRGHMPIMMLLLLFIIEKSSSFLNNLKENASLKILFLFVTIVVLNMVIPARHLMRAFQHNVFINSFSISDEPHTPYPYDHFTDFYQMGKEIYSIEEANQFLGVKGSFYEEYFARQKK